MPTCPQSSIQPHCQLVGTEHLECSDLNPKATQRDQKTAPIDTSQGTKRSMSSSDISRLGNPEHHRPQTPPNFIPAQKQTIHALQGCLLRQRPLRGDIRSHSETGLLKA